LDITEVVSGFKLTYNLDYSFVYGRADTVIYNYNLTLYNYGNNNCNYILYNIYNSSSYTNSYTLEVLYYNQLKLTSKYLLLTSRYNSSSTQININGYKSTFPSTSFIT